MEKNKRYLLIILGFIILFIMGFFIFKGHNNNIEGNKNIVNSNFDIKKNVKLTKNKEDLKMQKSKKTETMEDIMYNKICQFQRTLWKIKNKDNYITKFNEYINKNKDILNYLLKDKNKTLNNLLNTYYCISYRKEDLKYMKIIFLYYITNAYKCNKTKDWNNIFNNYLTDISCIDKTFKTNNFLKKEKIEYKTEKGNIVKETIYKFNIK